MRGRTSRPYDVAFYVPTLAPLLAGDRSRPPGGAETQVRLLAQALAAHGVKVALIAFAHPGLPAWDGDVRVLARPPHAGNPLREAWHIAAALRRVPSRVVVTRQAGAHTGLAAMVARALRRRFVYSAANVIDFEFRKHERQPLKWLLFEIGLRLADPIVAQTEEQAELCRRRRGRGAPVIRSIAERAERASDPGEYFLWAGRVIDYKQPLEFVRLARAVPEARFVMVAVPDAGLGPQNPLLAELREAAAEVENLTLLPPSSRTELLTVMERAVAVVSTSRTEGMPNIWLEGWSRGIPALTLLHDPDSLIADRGLGLAARGSAERLAGDAQDLWARRSELAELGARCIAYIAQEHAPDAVAAKWKMAADL